MPTENRSGNTEMVSELLPCPFCGEKPQITKHHREDIVSFMHRRQVLGPISWGFARRPASAHRKMECPSSAIPTAPRRADSGEGWYCLLVAKEAAERDAAEVGLPVVRLGPMTEPSAPAVSVPDGYWLMPRRLTAEIGAKALLPGEFKLEVTRECPECLELEEPAEGCEICDGEGEYAQRHTTPWVKINFIYGETVKGLVLQPNVAR